MSILLLIHVCINKGDPVLHPCPSGQGPADRNATVCESRLECESTCQCQPTPSPTTALPTTSSTTTSPTTISLTIAPISMEPTLSPSSNPSMRPTIPTMEPSAAPTMEPVISPTSAPTMIVVGDESPRKEDDASGIFLSTFHMILIGSIIGLLCIICCLIIFILLYKRRNENNSKRQDSLPTQSPTTQAIQIMTVSSSCEMTTPVSTQHDGPGTGYTPTTKQETEGIELMAEGTTKGETETDGDNEPKNRTVPMRKMTTDIEEMFGTLSKKQADKTPGFLDENDVNTAGAPTPRGANDQKGDNVNGVMPKLPQVDASAYEYEEDEDEYEYYEE